MIEELPPFENNQKSLTEEQQTAEPTQQTFTQKTWAAAQKYWWVPAIILPGGFIAIGIVIAKKIIKKK